MKNSSSRKKRVLKRGRLNFKDGEDVKCVLHKFPFLESSETLKIIPKSKFLFICNSYHITYFIYITQINYLFIFISYYIILFLFLSFICYENSKF